MRASWSHAVALIAMASSVLACDDVVSSLGRTKALDSSCQFNSFAPAADGDVLQAAILDAVADYVQPLAATAIGSPLQNGLATLCRGPLLELLNATDAIPATVVLFSTGNAQRYAASNTWPADGGCSPIAKYAAMWM